MKSSNLNGTPQASFMNELEGVKSDFIKLTNQIPAMDWSRKLPGGTWSAKQEMVHIVQALEVIPKGIDIALEGGKRSLLASIPPSIRHWVNGYIIIPARARNATKDSVIADYDRAFNALVKKLQTLSEGDWDKGAPYPRQFRTVAQMAHRPRQHFDEHAARLCKLLNIALE
jgi:hypothetical protein